MLRRCWLVRRPRPRAPSLGWLAAWLPGWPPPRLAWVPYLCRQLPHPPCWCPTDPFFRVHSHKKASKPNHLCRPFIRRWEYSCSRVLNKQQNHQSSLSIYLPSRGTDHLQEIWARKSAERPKEQTYLIFCGGLSDPSSSSTTIILSLAKMTRQSPVPKGSTSADLSSSNIGICLPRQYSDNSLRVGGCRLHVGGLVGVAGC